MPWRCLGIEARKMVKGNEASYHRGSYLDK